MADSNLRIFLCRNVKNINLNNSKRKCVLCSESSLVIKEEKEYQEVTMVLADDAIKHGECEYCLKN